MKHISPPRLIGQLHRARQLFEALQEKLLDVDVLNGRQVEGCLDDFLMPLGPETVAGIFERALCNFPVENEEVDNVR